MIKRLFSRKKEKKPPTKPQIQDSNLQGPMTAWFREFHLRKVSGEFYEILREGIPIFDGAINRLTSLNGTIKIIGDKAPLVKELEDFCLNVPVNDMQKGMQAFLQNFSNETFEQGFSISEFVATRDMKDIKGLKVADSKYIVFRKNKAGRAEPWYRYPGTMPVQTYSMPGSVIQQILNATYNQSVFVNGMYEEKLNMYNKLYFSINNENSDPYGVSIMRSTEFAAQILVTIQNSMKSIFERHGDPSYHIHIQTTGSKDDIEARRDSVKDDFNTLLKAKRQGKNADLVTAGDKNSEVKVKIIGADGKIVSFNEIPLKHLLQQILAKINLPAWMLGIYWSTTERMAISEVELVLQDAKIRQLAMTPEIIRLMSAYLTLRGHKWNNVTTSEDKPGDWGIIWETPNLRDIMALAKARFLNAQADMMESGAIANLPGDKKGSININGIKMPAVVGVIHELPRHGKACGCAGNCNHTKETRPDPWPALDDVETRYEDELKYDWAELFAKVLDILDIEEGKSAKGPGDIPGMETFTFSEDMRKLIFKELDNFLDLYDFKNSDSAVRWAYGEAYSLGVIQAAKLIGQARPILDIIKNREIYDELSKTGFKLVKDNATDAIKDQIIPALESWVEKGLNPRDVGARLKKLFSNKNSDWERLARTEITMAAERAKLHEWQEWGVQKVEFSTAPDACPICLALRGDYETGKAPVPGADTHPRCRCSIRPAASEV